MSRHAAPATRRARADRRAGTAGPAGSDAGTSNGVVSAADLVRRYRADAGLATATTAPLPYVSADPVRAITSTSTTDRPERLTVEALMARYGHTPQSGTRSHRVVRSSRVLPALPDLRFTARPALAAAAVLVTAAAAAEVPSLVAGSSATAAGGDRPAAAAGGAAGGAPTTSTAPGSSPSTGAGTTTPAGTTSPQLKPSTTSEATPTRVSRNTRRRVLLPQVHMKPGQTVPGIWVLPNPGPETSCFCQRWGTMHWGIDLAGPMGSPILAVGDGTVLEAGPADGFGNWVVVQHSNGDVSIYGHMQYYFVQPGQKVKAGQRIALVGSEGESTGPHLHFEVHQGGLNGQKIDPVPWLKARGINVGPYNPNG